MKKIFLSLLALVGMAGGLMCTSCSGGGGDKSGPSYAFAGKTVYLRPTVAPAMCFEFAQPSGSHVANMVFYCGNKTVRSSAGIFVIEQVGKSPSTGGWAIHGSVYLDDNDALLSDDFASAASGEFNDEVTSLRKFIVYFYVDKNGAPIPSDGASVTLEGTYGGGDNGGEAKEFSQIYPVKAYFTIAPEGSGTLDVAPLERYVEDFDHNKVEKDEDEDYEFIK